MLTAAQSPRIHSRYRKLPTPRPRVRCMGDVCAAHGDRAAVGVDIDAQGSSLGEDQTHFPLDAGVECRAIAK